MVEAHSQLIFDPTYHVIDDSTFQHHDGEEFYGDIKKAILLNALPPLEKEVELHMMVNSNHAGDNTTIACRVSTFPEHVAH
jgi:hypothetical protein